MWSGIKCPYHAEDTTLSHRIWNRRRHSTAQAPKCFRNLGRTTAGRVKLEHTDQWAPHGHTCKPSEAARGFPKKASQACSLSPCCREFHWLDIREALRRQRVCVGVNGTGRCVIYCICAAAIVYWYITNFQLLTHDKSPTKRRSFRAQQRRCVVVEN